MLVIVVCVAVSIGTVRGAVLPDTPKMLEERTKPYIEVLSRVVLSEGEVVETRSITTKSPISSIEISGGGIMVEVTCQQEQSLQIIGDPEMVRMIETDISDGQLQISGASWQSGKKGVVVKVGVQTLEDLEMSGANTIKITRLLANQLDVEMVGACVLDIAGKAKKLTIEASGACIVNAKDLIAEKIVVEAEGASKIIVNAEKQLCATVSGVSKIVYYGDPKTVNKDVCGMGRIVQQMK
jgi:hypothetical protein